MSKGKQAVKQAYKNMTGKELARLVLEHYVERDHNRPGLLSDADIKAIHNALTGRRLDILEFNAWLETYRLVYMTRLDGKVMSLEASRVLLFAMPYLEKFWLMDELKTLSYQTPAIVTTRQLQDYEEDQRQRLLSEIINLHEVVANRVYQVAMETLSKEEQDALQEELTLEKDLTEHLLEEWFWVQERLPEIWGKALSQLIELAEQDRLQAVKLSKADQDEIERARQAWIDLGGLWNPSSEGAYQHYLEVRRAVFERLRGKKENNRQTNKRALLEGLETLRAGSLESFEEITELETSFNLLTQDLYELGLPEWLEWVDEYKEGLEPTDLKTRKIAILQEDRLAEGDLDERGHYTKVYPIDQAIGKLSGFLFKQGFEDRGGVVEMCRRSAEAAAGKIINLLSMQAVLEILSEIIGVDLTEDFDELVSEVQSVAGAYNIYIDVLQASPESRQEAERDYAERYGERAAQFYRGRSLLPKTADLPRLDFEKLRPSQEWLDYYAERMAINLGPDWYKNIKEEEDLFRLALDTMAEASKATGRLLSTLEQEWQEALNE